MLRSVLVAGVLCLALADVSSANTTVRPYALMSTSELVAKSIPVVVAELTGNCDEDCKDAEKKLTKALNAKTKALYAKDEEEYGNSRLQHMYGYALISLICKIIFAVLYKRHVVDKTPQLTQRPISVVELEEDFPHSLFAFSQNIPQDRNYLKRDPLLSFHAYICCNCRAAHTWHVAGIFEYWPAVIILHFGVGTLCVAPLLQIYMRMKLKDRMGIRRNFVKDTLAVICCPCCAVMQEAAAVDTELGVRVGILKVETAPEMQYMPPSLEHGNFAQIASPNGTAGGAE